MKFISWYQTVPEYFFVSVALIFGLAFIIITPPFQVSDEIAHFQRAYQIANGDFVAERKDNRVGGELPASVNKVTLPFLSLRWNPENITTRDTIYRTLKIPLADNSVEFSDFPNTALYPPLSYLPQSTAIFVLRLFNTPPLFIYYGTKLFVLLFWTFCLYHILRILPLWKWEFAMLALLPMSLYVNASLSADVMCNIIAFAFIAFILKLKVESVSIGIKNKIFLILFSFALAAAKFVYLPLLFLVFLIPYKNIGSIRAYCSLLALMGLTAILTLATWSLVAGHLYITYEAYNSGFVENATVLEGADIKLQLQFILHHTGYFLKVATSSLYTSFDKYSRSYIGTMGWLDTFLSGYVIAFCYCFIFLTFISSGIPGALQKRQRVSLIAIFLLSMLTLLLSQYLIWNQIGDPFIDNVPGRYLIPFFPLALLGISGLTSGLKNNYRSILISAFSIALLFYSSYVLLTRYYEWNTFTAETVYCSAEKVTDKNTFSSTDPDIYFENANTQNSLNAHSGSYSALTTVNQQYAFTRRLYNLDKGDVLEVEIWKKGGDGCLVLDEVNLSYKSSRTVTIKESSGWKKITIRKTIQNNMRDKEIRIYAYNPSTDSTWFDDIKITHKRRID